MHRMILAAVVASLLAVATVFAQEKEPARLKAPFDQATAEKSRKEWAAWLKVPETRSLDLGGGAKMEFVLIPPGMFLMGSPEGEKDRGDNETLHEVTLTKAFYLALTETTQKQYAAVIVGDAGNPSHFQGDDLPVEMVSWDAAKAFCGKLSKGGLMVDLPTEAQWEYACRAGTVTPFHFGGVLKGDLANCNGTFPYGTDTKGPYLKKTTPVGTKEYPANAFGLRDMHGNVAEWCRDAYRSDYETSTNDNPSNDQGDRRVLRGGSWNVSSWDCRAACRYYYSPAYRLNYVGFRCVLLLP